MSARERECGELPSPDLSLSDRKVGQGLFVFRRWGQQCGRADAAKKRVIHGQGQGGRAAATPARAGPEHFRGLAESSEKALRRCTRRWSSQRDDQIQMPYDPPAFASGQFSFQLLGM